MTLLLKLANELSPERLKYQSPSEDKRKLFDDRPLHKLIDNQILTKQTVYSMTTMNFNKRAKLVSASSDLAGEIGFRCGRLLSVANAMLIITKHIDFYAADQVEAKDTSGEQVETEQ